jgi:EAL domain-containing protein (putative c-di-GMP-specific phosphodiesterase class I)
LGSYVLESACRQTQAWQDAGLGRLNVSVNLAPRQLQDEQLKSVIERCLEKTKLSPSQLELELTESAIMEDMQGVANLLSSLREIGLKVSVDDFGTGYSSLSYLRSLPVDALKIDREFVENMEHSVEQQAIVKAILVLGDSLGLQVVAEGVENDEQMRLLKILGCDLVQGYFVSKPVNAQKMEGLLTAQLDEVL